MVSVFQCDHKIEENQQFFKSSQNIYKDKRIAKYLYYSLIGKSKACTSNPLRNHKIPATNHVLKTSYLGENVDKNYFSKM
jgi:hypothetical protein